MTTATATGLHAVSAPRVATPSYSGTWLSRVIEFLLVGSVTLVLFPLAWVFRRTAGLDSSELVVGFLTFHGAVLVNDPHFSVTYLLFYRDAKNRAFGYDFHLAQRVRYLVAGAVVPLALAIWAIAALSKGSAQALGWMIQLMFFLVGWHYTKQAFGVLTVLSARRGVRFTALDRKAILAHCFAGWAYAWSSPFDPGKEVEEKGVVYTTLRHPPGLELATGVIFALSTVWLLWVLIRKWRREQRVPPLSPLIGFFATIWLWTVYTTLDPLMVYLIPALHSGQYLYFVWLMKRNEARAEEGPPRFGRPVPLRLAMLAGSAVVLGWILFHGAPTWLDGALVRHGSGSADAAALGPTPYFAAIFGIVNIHHYFMDAVIWRRDNPETRYLLD
jgi:hypothetical protein